MPFLSVIVPVYGVQGYLRECLDSILQQSFTDLEVIAVDDGGTDHCPDILDTYAERDPRIRVIHLEVNAGNGHARNLGLDQATGTYVWFVDGDDRLAAGALPAVVRALRADEPDVLLVDHSRLDPFGAQRPHDGAALPDRTGPMTLTQEPALVNSFTVAWNKVLRRDFLRRTGIRFHPGWYEDIPFTYPVLAAAERIATLNQVCYHYRRRHSAITSTRDERHCDVFDQWARVFDGLDRLADDHRHAGAAARAVAIRADVFHRMVWHLLVVAVMPDRLPQPTRRAFFRRACAHYHRYRPPGAVGPTGTTDRLRHRLLAADAYRSFRLLRGARRLAHTITAGTRKTARRLRTVAGTGLRHGTAAAGVALYHLLRLMPVDPRLAVYAAYWYRGYACNPAAVYDTARTLVPQVHGVWVVNRDRAATMPAGVDYVVNGSLRYYRTLARARWLINNVNFPDFVVKRRGTTHLQTHHGTPVKVMGVDQGAYPTGANERDLPGLVRRSDRWDFSLTANAHSTESWARAYPCRYETLELGYPRNDRLARAASASDTVSNVDTVSDVDTVTDVDTVDTRHRLGLPDDATVVLYAPTVREYVSGFRPLLDVADFAEALGPDVVVLHRAHYLYRDGGRPSHPAVRDVTDHPVVEDLLLAADVLVTDYSSVMFDYAVLDRPIAIYAPDWDTYLRTRGVTFDLLAEPPGVVATRQADLIDAFRTGAVRGDAAAKARTQFRARFSYLDDGHAAERVVRRVFAAELSDPLVQSR